jgi:hypothetical protein
MLDRGQNPEFLVQALGLYVLLCARHPHRLVAKTLPPSCHGDSQAILCWESLLAGLQLAPVKAHTKSWLTKRRSPQGETTS